MHRLVARWLGVGFQLRIVRTQDFYIISVSDFLVAVALFLPMPHVQCLSFRRLVVLAWQWMQHNATFLLLFLLSSHGHLHYMK